MQLDSLALARLADAARPLLVGGVVRDCHAAPDGQGIVMAIGGTRGPLAMAFSMSRRYSRWTLIDRIPPRQEALENHLSMVARQKLGGAVIEAVEVPEGERILILRLVRRDFTGGEEHLSFVAELMGPYSNLLLLDATEVILATWKVVHSYENAYREIRAGKQYAPPPPAGRFPMRAMSVDEWTQFFTQQPLEAKLQGALLQTFRGCTPGVVQAVLQELGWEKDLVIADVTGEQYARWAAAVEEVWIEVIHGQRLPPWDQWIPMELTGIDLHRAFAELYDQWERGEREGERAQQWRAALKHRESELKRLRGRYFEELGEHHRALANRRTGDLIYANLHLLPQQKLGYEVTIEVPDVFAHSSPPTDLEVAEMSDDELERLTGPESDVELVPITIPADKGALQVAREAHARASRAQRGIAEVEKRLELVAAEVENLPTRALEWQRYAGVDSSIWKKALEAFRSGKDRLESATAPPRKRGGGPVAIDAGMIPIALKPFHIFAYRLAGDLICFVGGNAVANEALWRYGESEHLWLHVKGLPGSHVLIPSPQGQVTSPALVDAARLAVSHSAVKEGTKIPVDYVQVRYLKKPPGTAPGYVIYTRERSLLVDPFDEHELKRRRL